MAVGDYWKTFYKKNKTLSNGTSQFNVRPVVQNLESNYELFNCNKLVYTSGAGITAAAGTRLALQLLLDEGFKLLSFQLHDL